MTERQKRLRHLFMSLASDFLNRESSKTSLITVTDAYVSADLSSAIVFVTVMPEAQENAALGFVKRKRSDFREYVKPKVRMKRIPVVDFRIDEGEKHRQNIDELSNETKIKE